MLHTKLFLSRLFLTSAADMFLKPFSSLSPSAMVHWGNIFLFESGSGDWSLSSGLLDLCTWGLVLDFTAQCILCALLSLVLALGLSESQM